MIMQNSTKKTIMLGILLLGCGLTSLFTSVMGKNNSMMLIGEEKSQKAANFYKDKDGKQFHKGTQMKIYISGAVQQPGIYDLPIGARADDAVLAAGGMTHEADPQRVNLALKLKDGMQVNVPFKKNTSKGNSVAYKYASKNYGNENSGYRNTSKLPGSKININTASAKELETLPGIGPSMAKRIVAYRQGRSFSRVEDLTKIQGIGKAKLEMLRGMLEV